MVAPRPGLFQSIEPAATTAVLSAFWAWLKRLITFRLIPRRILLSFHLSSRQASRLMKWLVLVRRRLMWRKCMTALPSPKLWQARISDSPTRARAALLPPPDAPRLTAGFQLIRAAV